MDLNKMKELEDRIKAPSQWGKSPCGIRFEDLQDVRYEEAVKFIKKHYLDEELTWRSLKISEDKEGTDELIHNVRIWLKDKMSIAVIREGQEKLVGLLVMRIQEKNAYSRTFSKIKLKWNPKYATVMAFYNEIEEKVKLFQELGVKRYLKIYILALKQRYRHRGIAKQLIKSAMGLSASGFIPAMSGIFTTGRSQQIATELGFQKYGEIYYVRYLIDGEIVFWDTGQGNYGAAIMAYRIPGVEEPVERTIVEQSRFTVKKEGDEEAEEEQQAEEGGEKAATEKAEDDEED